MFLFLSDGEGERRTTLRPDVVHGLLTSILDITWPAHQDSFCMMPALLISFSIEFAYGQRVRSIDKLYTQIGNVNRLHNIIEPFASLFWALGIVLAHILQ